MRTTMIIVFIAASVTAAAQDIPLASGVPYNGSIVGANPNESWQYFYVDLNIGTTVFVDLYDLTADLDLYVRIGAKPDSSTFDCRPYMDGIENENCELTVPVTGRLWIGVNNYETGTIFYTVKATWGDDAVFLDDFEDGTTNAWSSTG